MYPRDATPTEITPEIREFCRQLEPSREPLHVPHRPIPGAAAANPFSALKEHAARHGGRVQYGWIIREHPGWYLEAEFHGVWASPSGDLVDVAEPSTGAPSILFLPDTRLSYRGASVPNRFKALSTSPDVLAVVQNAEMHAQLRAQAETLARREHVPPGAAGRNDPCPCGSGLKYKKCCGRGGA